MNEQSDTPRTDAAEMNTLFPHSVSSKFARQLERELQSLTQSTELGKEREEIRYQAACSNLWYEKAGAAGTLKAIQIGSSIYQIPNIDPLVDEIARLKRELAEAEGKLPLYGEKNRRLNEQLLALSVSCQRQKEALIAVVDGQARHIAAYNLPYESVIGALAEAMVACALAETPDVSMWEKVVSVLTTVLLHAGLSEGFTKDQVTELLSTLKPEQP